MTDNRISSSASFDDTWSQALPEVLVMLRAVVSPQVVFEFTSARASSTGLQDARASNYSFGGRLRSRLLSSRAADGLYSNRPERDVRPYGQRDRKQRCWQARRGADPGPSVGLLDHRHRLDMIGTPWSIPEHPHLHFTEVFSGARIHGDVVPVPTIQTTARGITGRHCKGKFMYAGIERTVVGPSTGISVHCRWSGQHRSGVASEHPSRERGREQYCCRQELI